VIRNSEKWKLIGTVDGYLVGPYLEETWTVYLKPVQDFDKRALLPRNCTILETNQK